MMVGMGKWAASGRVVHFSVDDADVTLSGIWVSN
jgi:hypothetical protein